MSKCEYAHRRRECSSSSSRVSRLGNSDVGAAVYCTSAASAAHITSNLPEEASLLIVAALHFLLWPPPLQVALSGTEAAKGLMHLGCCCCAW